MVIWNAYPKWWSEPCQFIRFGRIRTSGCLGYSLSHHAFGENLQNCHVHRNSSQSGGATHTNSSSRSTVAGIVASADTKSWRENYASNVRELCFQNLSQHRWRYFYWILIEKMFQTNLFSQVSWLVGLWVYSALAWILIIQWEDAWTQRPRLSNKFSRIWVPGVFQVRKTLPWLEHYFHPLSAQLRV